MSRRAASLGFAVALLAGLVTFVVATTRTKSYAWETLGNNPAQPVAVLRAGQPACQRPLTLPRGVDRVQFVPGAAADARGPVRVSVRALAGPGASGGPVLARGTLERRPLTGSPVVVVLDRPVRTERFVAVCLAQPGRSPIPLWGEGGGLGLARSTAFEGARALAADLWLTFPRRAPASTLSRMPEAFSRAAPFKLGLAGAWTFWLLAALVVLAVPAALAYALRRAADDDSARS